MGSVRSKLVSSVRNGEATLVAKCLETVADDAERLALITAVVDEATGDTVLHLAAKAGDAVLLRALTDALQPRSTVTPTTVPSTSTAMTATGPMMVAAGEVLASQCGADVMKLAHVAALDVKNALGHTALHCALNQRDGDFLEITKSLLDAGASATTSNVTGGTPLHSVVQFLAIEQVPLPPHTGSKVTRPPPRGVAGTRKSLDAVEVIHRLIAAGADVDAANNGGKTPSQLVEACVAQLPQDLHSSNPMAMIYRAICDDRVQSI